MKNQLQHYSDGKIELHLMYISYKVKENYSDEFFFLECAAQET